LPDHDLEVATVTSYQRTPYLVVHRHGAGAREVYGAVGEEQVVLHAQLLRGDADSDTAVVAMHPMASPGYLPMFSALAKAGCHVIACASRYINGDHSLIMENVLLDLAACIHDARTRLGYRRIILAGWSGGGSLMLFYQSQAEHPTVQAMPSGEPVDLAEVGLVPADAVVLLAAHRSRHHLLTECLDPSVLDEDDPTRRDPELNLYDPNNPNQPPYSEGFLLRYRMAQIERNERITAWARDQLATPPHAGTTPNRSFVVHGTMADPRWLDPALEPNDRRPGWCYLGDPGAINDGPTGLARFTTPRSWLSQWSWGSAQGDGAEAAASVTVPALIVHNSADDACPTSHTDALFGALRHPNKELTLIRGANHYFSGPGQQRPLDEATTKVVGWLTGLPG
jgi:pimeloyl-ACP methyl ester carboxylesterase